MHKFSRVFGTPLDTKSNVEIVSKTQKLFSELGLLYTNNGICTLMPILVKSLKKLEEAVHKKMKEIPALEVRLPLLMDSKLLEKSGRQNLPILFRTNVKNYILSPTCEEVIANLIGTHRILKPSQLPLSFYQISTKFRDEDRPRGGLLRTKEFLMKDLYIFNSNKESSEESYQKVHSVYHQFFSNLNVPFCCVEGSTGDIGGLKSHEFHFPSSAGQDKIVLCQNCGHNENMELSKTHGTKCSMCQSSDVKVETSIEVGHTFNLGTTLTKPFNVHLALRNVNQECLEMSSFGLGLTRILAASVEVLCKSDKIIWPLSIAPYLVCLVPPKSGSKEDKIVKNHTNDLYNLLNNVLEDDVIIDDRTSLTVGQRMQLLKKIGFPLIIILNKQMANDPPMLEIIDSVNDSVTLIQIPDAQQFILDKLQSNLINEPHKQKSTVQSQ